MSTRTTSIGLDQYVILSRSEPAKMLKSPFPWFGGKSTVAPIVWERFAGIVNYVEPFFGSGAVLLGRPEPFSGIETVNDKDGYVANFWRALQADPDRTASYADWPVNENDLHARHTWLVEQKDSLVARLEGDPEFYDPKIAGWWVWGICCWIGSGFCSGRGPWQVVNRKLVHLGSAGQGVNRQRVHLGSAGQGVNRKRVTITNHGVGVTRNSGGLVAWMNALSDRLKRVRVCCGDWSRVCGATPTCKQGLTGVFLDPPYPATDGRSKDLYATDDLSVAHDARRWAIENEDNPLLRIALCGYEPMKMPDRWSQVNWMAQGGYGGGKGGLGENNRHREVIWFSPQCQKAQQEILRFESSNEI